MIFLCFLLFVFATLAQAFYWLAFARLAFYEPPSNDNEAPCFSPMVSIVVCAKNEADNLRRHLPLLLQQQYPCFEVLVVDDGSNDDTQSVLASFKAQYTDLLNFIYINPDEKGNRKGKKYPLSKGIALAKSEWLLLTDADCAPQSHEWLATMVAAITPEKRVVLGFSPYMSQAGFLNLWIRFEAVQTAIQYVGFALWGVPYMGVGRNLLYNKNLYNKENGFLKHEKLASGDDDLFINAVATADNTTVCLHPKSFVLSQPKTRWFDYYQQKRRHLSTATSYRFVHQLLLGGFSLTHFLHYFFGINLLFFNLIYSKEYYTPYIIGITFGLLLLKMVLYFYILKKLQQRTLWRWILLLDALLFLYYFIMLPWLFFRKHSKWT